ncbi:MAG: hypothetical protein QM669_01895 [Siphonobacter sp.]
MVRYLFLLILIPFLSRAHVGSSGVVYEGKAGNYPIQVYVQPPDVIPGTAKVTVLAGMGSIQEIGLKPIYFYGGDEGSPRADLALPSKEEPGRYEGTVWFMDAGSASVEVTIKGNQGTGTAVIPILAVSTATQTMPKGTGWVLAGLGLLLLGLLTTLLGASMSDGLMQPGQEDTSKTRRKHFTGSVIGATFCIGLVFVGHNWWKARADEYKQFMFKPYQATSSIAVEDGQPVLNLQIDSLSEKNRSLSYLIPDHGKLMHLFLIRQGSMEAFAHLHPYRVDSLHFQARLPPLPAGTYLLYADMVRYQGFAYTITDTLVIPALPESLPGSTKADPEDTYAITTPVSNTKPLLADAAITMCGKPGVSTKLQDGSSMVWEAQVNEDLRAGKVYDLNFSVFDPDGKAAELQPYLGMMGHAAVFKNDGQVYIHLHPTGTFSSASQQVLKNRIAETNRIPAKPSAPKVFRDSIDQVLVMLNSIPEMARNHIIMPDIPMSEHLEHTNHLTIPYAFPKAGKYRLWLQVKRDGKVLTGVFDANVQ